MRISDWSSDVCSSDLEGVDRPVALVDHVDGDGIGGVVAEVPEAGLVDVEAADHVALGVEDADDDVLGARRAGVVGELVRSEEHTSELQSLMRISYAVFCLKKKTQHYLL